MKVDRELVQRALELLADDMDTPKMLARLFAVVDSIDADDHELRAAIQRLSDEILGLDLFSNKQKAISDKPSDEVVTLAEQRRTAKSEKDRSTADRLRDEIATLGWKMVDGKDGYELERA